MAKLYYQNLNQKVANPAYEDQYIGPLTGLAHGSKLGKSTTFANSLLGQHKKFGGKLTASQWNWVRKLVEQASSKPVALQEESVGDFSGVIKLFETAKGNMFTKGKKKSPVLSMIGEEGNNITLKIAGPNAKKPGSINVTDGGPYGNNIWYGRVLADGTWEKSSKATREVKHLLQELSVNPHAFATKYGKMHSSCCFCNKTLTQKNSIAVGYGPICADNWGLTSEWKAAAK